MDAFRFSPELLQLRIDAMAALDRAGYLWLSHFSSVDCMHDLYGIEVCGIHQEDDAWAIHEQLVEMYPNWFSRYWYKDYGREQGWIAEIHRDRRREWESWETA